jgi:hypothetical protein
MAEFSESTLELGVVKVNRAERDDFFNFLGACLANHFDIFSDNFCDFLFFNIFCHQVLECVAAGRFKV